MESNKKIPNDSKLITILSKEVKFILHNKNGRRRTKRQQLRITHQISSSPFYFLFFSFLSQLAPKKSWSSPSPIFDSACSLDDKNEMWKGKIYNSNPHLVIHASIGKHNAGFVRKDTRVYWPDTMEASSRPMTRAVMESAYQSDLCASDETVA